MITLNAKNILTIAVIAFATAMLVKRVPALNF